MLSKCVIAGTKHSIIGGGVCVDGTTHSLRHSGDIGFNGSNVRINGTGHKTLIGDEWTIYELGKHMTRYAYAGYNSATAGKPSISLTDANNYIVIYAYNGYVGIYKMVSTGSAITSTQIANNSTGVTLTTSGTTVTPSSNRYGSTLYALTFDGDIDEAVAVLQDFDYVRLAGRNSATAGTVSFTFTYSNGNTPLFSASGDWWIQCTGANICMRMVATPASASTYGTYTDGLPSNMPSGNGNKMYHTTYSTSTDVGTCYLSLDESTNVSVYGGSIISCRRK